MTIKLDTAKLLGRDKDESQARGAKIGGGGKEPPPPVPAK